MIYYCIPVHNEEKTAGVVLWKIRQVMADFPRDYQILLADDASSDGTVQVLDPYRRVLPLILLRSNRRRGYAASLEMLLREAARRSRYPRRDIVVVMQADFSDDAEHAPALLRRLESGADLAVGGPIDGAERSGLLAKVTGRLARRLLRRKEWPEPITDPLNGFTAIRLACIKRAFEEQPEGRLLRWEGRAANAALLAAVAPHARRIDAVEMTVHPERRQRPARSRPIPTLREVYRFVRARPAPGLLPPDALVPDEVHGDLSALGRPHAPAPETSGRSPRPGRDEGEQRGERARKDGKPQRSRRGPRPPAAAPPDGGPPGQPGDGEPVPPATGEAAAGEAPPRRRRGTRGGERSRRKPREGKPRAAAAADEGQPPDGGGGPADNGQGAPTGPDEPGSGPVPGSGPKRRGRRGRRGRSGRRPGSSAAGPAGSPEAQTNGPDGGPAERDEDRE